MAGLNVVSSIDGSCNSKVSCVLKAIADGEKLTHVDLSNCGLTSVPDAIFELGDSLELLNLGGNNLFELPDSMIKLQKLRILFFAQNKFQNIPIILGKLSSLFMLSFKSNQVSYIDGESLSPSICWLILSDNIISEIPSSIGKLTGLRKLMLAGNELTTIPDAMQYCKELQLVRLAANKIRLNSLPSWFWNLPKLSWVAIAGNINDRDDNAAQSSHNTIEWTDLDIMEKLGEGASGIIYKAKWRSNNISNVNLICNVLDDDDDRNFVAVKLFKGGRTSDGLPEDEMKAAEAAGKHSSSFEVYGRIINAPNNQLGLVMPLIPNDYKILGGPPSFATVTRDTFDIDKRFVLKNVLKILTGISSVCDHLHKRGISHGDLYAHNILVNSEGSCLLSDFGASSFYHKVHMDDVGTSIYGQDSVVELISSAMEGFEVRAFGCLIEDLLDRVSVESGDLSVNNVYENVLKDLRSLLIECSALQLSLRPTFQSINTRLVEIGSILEKSLV